MRSFISIVFIAGFLGASVSCVEKCSVSYSYMQNGLQSLEYTAILANGHVAVSYDVLLTRASYNNNDELDFEQTSRSGTFSFDYENILELQSSFQFLEEINNPPESYDYVNEFKVSVRSKQAVLRIGDGQDITEALPPYLSRASCLIEFHKYVLEKIGKDLDVDWHCFYKEILTNK